MSECLQKKNTNQKRYTVMEVFGEMLSVNIREACRRERHLCSMVLSRKHCLFFVMITYWGESESPSFTFINSFTYLYATKVHTLILLFFLPSARCKVLVYNNTDDISRRNIKVNMTKRLLLVHTFINTEDQPTVHPIPHCML